VIHCCQITNHTVDGQIPAPVDMENIHEYPSICKVLYIPDGAGFLPSTVSKFNPSFVRRLAMHHTDAFVPVPTPMDGPHPKVVNLEDRV